MSKVKVDLANKVRRNKNVTVKADPLVVDLDVKPLAVAEAMARDVKQQIEAQPDNKWDKTGTLKAGIRAEQTSSGYEVVPPPERLGSDDLLQRFTDEVMRPDPFQAPGVNDALDALLTKMLGGRQ